MKVVLMLVLKELIACKNVSNLKLMYAIANVTGSKIFINLSYKYFTNSEYKQRKNITQ